VSGSRAAVKERGVGARGVLLATAERLRYNEHFNAGSSRHPRMDSRGGHVPKEGDPRIGVRGKLL
jgi:hypothetical protein